MSTKNSLENISENVTKSVKEKSKASSEPIRFRTGSDLLDLVVGGDKGVMGFPCGKFVNIVGDRSAGKAQPLYSKILTPSGWTTMGEIHCGDVVCTPDGGSAEVIGEFPQGKRKIYRMYMSDGTYVDSADNHYWIVQSPNQAHSPTSFKKPNGESLVTTEEIVSLYEKQTLKIPANRLFLPECKPLDLHSHKPIKLPPYLMGVLIADGGLTAGLTVTFTEPDVKARVSKELFKLGYVLNVTDNDITYRLSCVDGKNNSWIPEYIRELGLNCKSVEKHIPEEYLYSSKEIRTELLHGML